MVNADIHHVMAHDPLFVEPEKFAPDRYISEDGKTLKKVRTRIILFYLRCCFPGLDRSHNSLLHWQEGLRR